MKWAAVREMKEKYEEEELLDKKDEYDDVDFDEEFAQYMEAKQKW